MPSSTEPLIRDISDTARWAAVYRARESERADALFHDPLAKRLAGERGEQIAAGVRFTEKHAWSWTARTYLFDHFITEQLRQGVDMVVNLAAGLDARPYRMDLSPSLQWVEVDLPGLLDYKEEVLAGEAPRCALERVRLDLADVAARRALFARLGDRARKALIISEGLLLYLAADEVGALARDLAAPTSFQRWIVDLVSPGLLRMMKRKMGRELDRASAPFKFASEEGPGFFTKYGWGPVEVRSLFRTAAQLRRLPLFMQLMAAIFPDPKLPAGKQIWSGVLLLAKQGT